MKRGPGRPKGVKFVSYINQRVDAETARNIDKLKRAWKCDKSKAIRKAINDTAANL